MADALPLPTLLSHILVAFTIEFDNEFERQMPHRTTDHGATGTGRAAPWLTSLAMWSTCMRFVGDAGISVRELECRARTWTNLNGMVRWGYIRLSPDPSYPRPKQPRDAWLITATAAGRRAQQVWRPLFGTIEARWQARFGEAAIGDLRESLHGLVERIDPALPDCMPILGYGLFSQPSKHARQVPAAEEDRTLAAMLARALVAFAVEFERDWPLSLAISANLLRVLDPNGIPIRDLPLLTGVSKEAISMAMGILAKQGLIVTELAAPGSRLKRVRLTLPGIQAAADYRRRIDQIEQSWCTRFGEETICGLRKALERLLGAPNAASSPLWEGLIAPAGCWRASVRKPDTLPHFPMVLHRGGYPDGS